VGQNVPPVALKEAKYRNSIEAQAADRSAGKAEQDLSAERPM
jgi:hypothetical protein